MLISFWDASQWCNIKKLKKISPTAGKHPSFVFFVNLCTSPTLRNPFVKVLFFCLIFFSLSLSHLFLFLFFLSSFSFFSFSNFFFPEKIYVHFQDFQKCQNIQQNAGKFQNLRRLKKKVFLFIRRRWYTNIMPSAMTLFSYTLRRLWDQTYKEESIRMSTILKFTCAHSQNPCTPNNKNSTTLTNKV